MEWFDRIRYKALILSIKVENYGCTLRYGYSVLNDLLLKIDDFIVGRAVVLKKIDLIFFAIDDAFSKSNDYLGLIGFSEFWSKTTRNISGFKFQDSYLTFLEASILCINGRLEAGVSKYSSLLMIDNCHFKNMACTKILYFLQHLQLWEPMKEMVLNNELDIDTKTEYQRVLALWENDEQSLTTTPPISAPNWSF